MPNDFDANVQKFIAASAYSLVLMNVAREMFGKGYFALGVQEKAIVEAQTTQLIGANFHAITPELFAGQTAPAPAGFQPATLNPDQKKTP